MKRVLGSVLFVLYSIIAITVTVLLLSYNEYNCSELGGYTVYIVKDDSMEPRFKQGSILLIRGSSDRNIKKGDDLIFYKVINSQEFQVVNGVLSNKTQQGRHITYTLESGENYADDYLIGKSDNTIVIEGLGVLLSILQSKWGYLFCIVVVSLLLFLQEVFDLIVEIKYGGENAAKGSKGTKNGKKGTSAKSTTSRTTTAKRTTTTRKTTQAPKAGQPAKVAKTVTTVNNAETDVKEE